MSALPTPPTLPVPTADRARCAPVTPCVLILGKLDVGSQVEVVAVLFDTPPGRAGGR